MRNNYIRITNNEMEKIIRNLNTFTVLAVLAIVLMAL